MSEREAGRIVVIASSGESEHPLTRRCCFNLT
jgi:hypothetical protein